MKPSKISTHSGTARRTPHILATQGLPWRPAYLAFLCLFLRAPARKLLTFCSLWCRGFQSAALQTKIAFDYSRTIFNKEIISSRKPIPTALTINGKFHRFSAHGGFIVCFQHMCFQTNIITHLPLSETRESNGQTTWQASFSEQTS